MAKSIRYALTALLLGYLLTAPAEAQQQKMYTWTDENGVVHFSDIEPTGQQVQEQAVPMNEPTGASNPYAAPGQIGPSLADQKRQEIARKNLKNKINQTMKNAQCAAWEAERSRLEPTRQIFFTNEQGETERMDDVERTTRVAQLKKQIAQNCR